MQIVNKPIVNLDGEQLKSGDIDLTVAIVLVNCALAPTSEGKARPEADVAARWDVALRLHKLEVGESFDIKPELMVELKKDLLRVYSTVVSGQMLPVMNGEASH